MRESGVTLHKYNTLLCNWTCFIMRLPFVSREVHFRGKNVNTALTCSAAEVNPADLSDNFQFMRIQLLMNLFSLLWQCHHETTSWHSIIYETSGCSWIKLHKHHCFHQLARKGSWLSDREPVLPIENPRLSHQHPQLKRSDDAKEVYLKTQRARVWLGIRQLHVNVHREKGCAHFNFFFSLSL